MQTIHAVYENGVFRPIESVEWPEGTQVEILPSLTGTDQDDGLDEIYEILSHRYASGEHDVAARHNEHQP